MIIKLKSLINEVSIDRLQSNDDYLDEIAKKFKYKFDFNNTFWKFPRTLYHCTKPENKEEIEREGLKLMKITRGINTRFIPPAIFTTVEELECDHLEHYYGKLRIAINTLQMKRDGFMPPVSQEPQIERANKLVFVFEKLGINVNVEKFIPQSEGISENTVIIYKPIPPKYLSIYD